MTLKPTYFVHDGIYAEQTDLATVEMLKRFGLVKFFGSNRRPDKGTIVFNYKVVR